MGVHFSDVISKFMNCLSGFYSLREFSACVSVSEQCINSWCADKSKFRDCKTSPEPWELTRVMSSLGTCLGRHQPSPVFLLLHMLLWYLSHPLTMPATKHFSFKQICSLISLSFNHIKIANSTFIWGLSQIQWHYVRGTFKWNINKFKSSSAVLKDVNLFHISILC